MLLLNAIVEFTNNSTVRGYMNIPYEAMRALTSLTVQETINESIGPHTIRFNDVEYMIEITQNVFMGLDVMHKDGSDISIGNYGIHINSHYIHSHFMEMKTEEEFFQFSLLNDYQDLEYHDYVRMVKYQDMMVTALPLKRGKNGL